jgi:hypothetical protein
MNPTLNPHFSVPARRATLAAALVLTLVTARAAKAATVTVSSTCTFDKAVASINAGANRAPCTHSGTYGSNDTVVIPVGNFYFGTAVSITRSMTIHGGGKWDTFLQTTNASASYAILVQNPSIVVKIDNLSLSATYSNTATGIWVMGANDTNLNDNNLELNLVVIASFGSSGILNQGGRVLVQHSLIYLNSANFGGGVANVTAQNNNGTTAVGSFVSKYSAISLNTAAVDGGGIYNTAKMDLRSTLLQENYAEVEGGAIFVSAAVSNASCNLTRDVATADPSEVDDNVADIGYGIVASSIPCTFHDTIGSGNSSPYCTANTVNCPQ